MEHDTDTRVNLQNVHMMTDKSNCAQLQVIFQSMDKQSCPSYLHCGVLQIDRGNIYGGLKSKNLRESESGSVMLKFLLRLMSELF